MTHAIKPQPNLPDKTCCIANPGTKIGASLASPEPVVLDLVEQRIPSQRKPQIRHTNSQLSTKEKWRNVLVRWAYRRHDHRVSPGLWALGDPDLSSPVVVTSNYKLTFDIVRSSHKGHDVWLMLLDTKGINVWCAAGKGTFGTNELVQRVRMSNLALVVEHRTLILPQLGAPGVAAHEVESQTGFRVKYGPVYAKDLPEFLSKGMRKTPEMSRIHFTFPERLAVVPTELVHSWKLLIIAFLVAFFLHFLQKGSAQSYPFIVIPGSIFVGTIAFAALLPMLPTLFFSSRGALLGGIWVSLVAWLCTTPWSSAWPSALIATAFTSYLAMNYTGCSTFTSQHGVEREVRSSVPWIAGAVLAGLLVPVVQVLFL